MRNGAPFFQIALIVPQLEAAMTELNEVLGLTFREPLNREIGPWRLRVTFSRQGPPFFELTEGQPGSPWDPTGAPRIDHLGWWSSDLTEDATSLAEAGAQIEVDGRAHGKLFTYHRAPITGLRLELIGIPPREFYETWELPGDPPE